MYQFAAEEHEEVKAEPAKPNVEGESAAAIAGMV